MSAFAGPGRTSPRGWLYVQTKDKTRQTVRGDTGERSAGAGVGGNDRKWTYEGRGRGGGGIEGKGGEEACEGDHRRSRLNLEEDSTSSGPQTLRNSRRWAELCGSFLFLIGTFIYLFFLLFWIVSIELFIATREVYLTFFFSNKADMENWTGLAGLVASAAAGGPPSIHSHHSYTHSQIRLYTRIKYSTPMRCADSIAVCAFCR